MKFTPPVVILALLCLLGLSAATAQPSHPRPGSHGMVLFNVGSQLYASHLPLYHRPHDYQLIYAISTEHQAPVQAYLEATATNAGEAVVTLLPEPFDLNTLIAKHAPQLQAQFFKGHFERGGTPWLAPAKVHFTTPVLVAPVDPGNRSAGVWYARPLTATTTLYVHNIDHRPSFDALVLADHCDSPPQAVDHPDHIPAAFASCQMVRVVYTDTADFAQASAHASPHN